MTKARNIADLGSNDVIETTATGVDVTGTVTADGLTVENNTTDVKGVIKNTLTGGGRTATLDIIPQNDNSYGLSIQTSGGSGTGTFKFNNKNTMKFDFNNDVHFYEDTGTTAKFVWDASAESLNLGSTSSIYESAGGDFFIKDTNSGADVFIDSGRRIRFNANGSERMRIDSSGNVGLRGTGVTSEDVVNKLDFYSTTSSINLAGIQGRRTAGGTNYGSLIFTTTSGGSSTEKARIDSSGNLLVGTTSGTDKVNISQGTGGTILSVHSQGTSGAYAVAFKNPNGTVGNITISGTTTTYNTSSDERLKENIQDTTHPVDIDDIQVREFDWKVNGSHQRYGFIAQELETVYPEAVHSPDEADEMKSVDYSKLVPLLVKEIQTLKARIETLENK